MSDSSSDRFLWIGATGASWTTGTNWKDVTTGSNPATVAPGAGSDDEIDGTAAGLIVAGPGIGGTLTIDGASGTSVALTGTNSFTDLVIPDTGTVFIAEGAVTADALTLTAGATAETLGPSNSLTINSTVALTGDLLASNGAHIHLAGLALDGGIITTAVNGSVVIGDTAAGASGVTIDAGSIVTGSATLSDGYGVSASGGFNILAVTGTLTVDGTLDATAIDNLGSLTGTGTIEVMPDGYFRSPIALVNGQSGALLTFQVDTQATLELPATGIGPSNHIELAGTGTSLVFNTEYDTHVIETNGFFPAPFTSTTEINATVSGLARGDHFVFGLMNVGGSASTAVSGTTLSVLGSDSSTIASLNFDAIPDGVAFLLTPTPVYFNLIGSGLLSDQGLTQVDAVESTAYGPGTGGDAIWLGTGSGAFGDGANWSGGVAPGAGSTASITGPSLLDNKTFTVISQVGQVGTLDLAGMVALRGGFAATALNVAAAAMLEAGVDSVVTAQDLTVAGAGASVTSFGNGLNGTGGQIDVAGTLDLGSGNSLQAGYGGRVQAKTLNLGASNVTVSSLVPTAYGPGPDLLGEPTIIVTSTATDPSAITIGSQDDAANGTIQIDQDGMVVQTSGPAAISADHGIIVNGGIIAQGLTLQGVLSGTGTIEAAAGGSVTVANGGLTADAALKFTIDTGASLQLQAANFGTGSTVTFNGAGSTLTFGEFGTSLNPAIGTAIAGFGPQDRIVVGSVGLPNPVNATRYTQTSAAGGTLSLLDGNGMAEGTLHLMGDYTSQNFIVTPVSTIDTEIVLAEAGTFPTSLGTATGDSFSFSGSQGANLADAANWHDDTTNAPAAVAPGLLDNATLSGDSALIATSGAASVNSLTIGGTYALSGNVTAASLESAQFGTFQLYIDPGASLTVQQAELQTFMPVITVTGAGANFTDTGTLSANTLGLSFAVPQLTVAGGGSATIGSGGDYFLYTISGTSTLTLNSGTGLPPQFGAGVTFTGTGGTLHVGTTTSSNISLATLAGFLPGDTLQISALDPVASVAFNSISNTTGTLTYLDAGGQQIGSTALSLLTSTTPTFTVTPVSANEVAITEQVPCFTAGTSVQTASGAVAVEDMRVGDTVVTRSGHSRRVRWIGHRTVACHSHPQPQQVWPIRIQTSAFQPGVPSRDLHLSPDHAVFAAGVLIPVKHLVNGASIVQIERDEVTYYHVELDRHDVILAEDLPCETYLDNGSRTAFANGGRITQLHPDFSAADRCEAIGEALSYAPLRIAGPEVEQIRARLSRRAAKIGHAIMRTKRKPPARPFTPSFDLTASLQTDWYLANNPDVAAAGIDPAAHYVRHGHQEGRMPCPEAGLIRGLGLIDAATVIRTMPDVVEAGADPVDHFCAHGWREGRRPNAYFDIAWYQATHAVLADMNPLVHYVLFGETSGLMPSPHFDPAWYRTQYGLAPTVSPLAHYLQHRRTQQFSPLPGFDVAAYCEKHATSMLSDRDPYAHFLAIGRFAPATEERAAA